VAPGSAPGGPPTAEASGWLTQAWQRLAQGDLEGGRRLAATAVQGDPACGPGHLLLAMVCVQEGQAGPALEHARQAASLCPGDARAQLVLGRAHKLAHALPQAVEAYRSALALQPDLAEAHVSLGIALKHGGDLAGALQCYERAVALKPELAAARANLAYTRAALAERALEAGADAAPGEDVIEEARQATRLDPGNAQLHFNLGLLLRRARQRAEAIDTFNRALGAAPGRDDICLNLGHELVAGGMGAAAVRLYEHWLQTQTQTQMQTHAQPPSPAVMRALANQLTREGRAGEALAWAERVAALEPDPRAWLQLCHSYQQCRRLPEALAAGRKAIEVSGRAWAMYSVPLMVANYLVEDAAELAALHAEAGAALAAELPLQWAPAITPAITPAIAPAVPAAPGLRRLRVAYVSADFISHSVAFFMAPLLQHHDRTKFEVWCYYNRGWGDETTAQLRACADHWVECEHLSDEALAHRMRADGIDILVDLSGHTSGARLGVLARGAAALQVSYLGYPTVTGVQGVHHRITDHVIDPGDQPDIGSERPLVMRRSMFCYRPPEARECPDVAPEPPSRRGPVTFGSFNNVAKLSDRTLALWARVLHAVPGSRLLLKAAAAGDAATQRSIIEFMAGQGVQAARLEMRPRIGDRREHLALYGEVDVALDSHPYNGATTTCEALWMGVPVVTRAGRTHPSRMGASILAAAGQAGWVCHDDDRFVALAAALAADESARSEWRAQARLRLRRSELMDEAGFVAAYEVLLLQAWQGRAVRQV